MHETDERAQAWTRRNFLRVGAAGGALLAVGGVIARCTGGPKGGSGHRLVGLTEAECAIVAALCSRVLATSDPAYPRLDFMELSLYIDKVVGKMDEQSRKDLSDLLHLIEHVLPLRIGRLSRFTSLEPRDQDAVLANMMTSSIGLLRGAFDAFKGLCMMAYFRDPRSWEAIGYDGPLVGRPAQGWVAASRLSRSAR